MNVSTNASLTSNLKIYIANRTDNARRREKGRGKEEGREGAEGRGGMQEGKGGGSEAHDKGKTAIAKKIAFSCSCLPCFLSH